MLKDLIARRVPHILGIYLAAGWAVLEFSDYLVNRYVLSPHLTDFALVGWGSMIPTVLMLAYFHGRPRHDEWTMTEKIGIPINLVAAAALLFFTFGGKDLGAATTEITVEDETGVEVERVVPKSEFRKRLALFYFDNESGDTILDWLQYGIPIAVHDDLLQDLFIDGRGSWPYFHERLKEEGYIEGVGLPLALRRDIAERLHLEYFVSGTVDGSEDELVVTLSLYDVRRGTLIQERTFTGGDLFALVDEMSGQLKRDLEVPEHHIEEARDLPFAELSTTSLTAYRSFVAGMRAMELEKWDDAAAAFNAAVKEDRAYAFANLYLFNAYFLLNESERANEALKSAMEYGYKLPERYQFAMKANYYLLVKQDSEKARAAAGMLTELFPEDVSGHAMQLQLAASAGEREKAIASATRILELDPSELEMLRTIGQLYEEMGAYKQARSYYEKYAAEAPRDPRGFNDLGNLSRTLGAHDQALKHYERALLVETDNVPVLIDLARTEAALGRFDRAVTHLDEAVAAAKTPLQLYQAYAALHSFSQRRGEMTRAIEHMHLSWAELEQGAPPFRVLMEKLGDLDTYVKAGKPEVALATMKEVGNRLSPPLDLLLALGQLDLALELEDAEGIEDGLAGMERLIEALGLEVLRPVVAAGNGRLLEIRGSCEQAIIAFERALELAPTGATASADGGVAINTDIGRCLRKLGRHDQAVERFQRALKVEPFAPQTHLELARTYAEFGKPEKAIEHLQVALSVWENADPEFTPAQEARDALAELQPSL